MSYYSKVIEWISRAETINTLIHTEFFRTLLWPLVSAMLTGSAGLFGGIPIMWVMVGASITFMTIPIGMLGVEGLRERRTPQNKISYKVVFQSDLNEAPIPWIGSKNSRRSQPQQMLAPSQLDPKVHRKLERAQLGVELTNNALFPISCILQSAETEVEGEKPPRSTFPKNAVAIPPGGSVRLLDDRIEMNDLQCQRLSGKMDMRIKYGLAGNENFEIHVTGGVDIIMENFGLVSAVVVSL